MEKLIYYQPSLCFIAASKLNIHKRQTVISLLAIDATEKAHHRYGTFLLKRI